MAEKHPNGRVLRRRKPAEGFASKEVTTPEASSEIAFELRRIDSRTTSMNAGLDRLIAEMPPEGERVPTNLGRMIVEDRE